MIEIDFLLLIMCLEPPSQRLLRDRYQMWCDYDVVRQKINQGADVPDYEGLTEEPGQRMSIESIKNSGLESLRHSMGGIAEEANRAHEEAERACGLVLRERSPRA